MKVLGRGWYTYIHTLSNMCVSHPGQLLFPLEKVMSVAVFVMHLPCTPRFIQQFSIGLLIVLSIEASPRRLLLDPHKMDGIVLLCLLVALSLRSYTCIMLMCTFASLERNC